MPNISLETLVEQLNKGGWVRKVPSKKRDRRQQTDAIVDEIIGGILNKAPQKRSDRMQDANIARAEIIDGVLYLRDAAGETIVALESERLQVLAHEQANVPFDVFVSGPRMVKEMRKKIAGGGEHLVERIQIVLHLYNGTNLSKLRDRRLQDFFGRGAERVMDGKLVKMLYHDAGKALELRFENAPSIMLANVYDPVLDVTLLHLKVGDEAINLDTGEASTCAVFDLIKQ